MSQSTMLLDIVSAEASIFQGDVRFIAASGISGELGIAPGHTALLTLLKPGQIVTTKDDGTNEVFYISGGMLEIQPEVVTVLADTAIRAADLDEAAASAAKEQAEKVILNKTAEVEYSRALAELAEASAQLRAIQKLRDRTRR